MLHISIMRKLDFWLGAPLCFIFTLIYKLQRLVGLRNPAGTPQRILFIELAEMGSSILSYPAMAEAKRRFPHAELFFLIFHELQDSVHLLNIVPRDHVLTIRSSSFFGLLWDTLKFPFVARNRGIDTVIDLEFFSRFSAILTFLSGCKRSSGFYRFNAEGMYRGNFFSHKVQFNPYLHTGEAYLTLLLAFVAPLGEVPYLKKSVRNFDLSLPKLTLSKDDRSHILNKIKSIAPSLNEKSKIVLINPNSSYLITLRRWPLHNYALLAKKLLQDANLIVITTGVASEKSNAQYIKNFVQSDRCIDMAGETSLKELLMLYQLAEVLVTNDSGPAQFAALTPIKIFVFFGPETPIRFQPLSPNVEALYADFACSPCVTPFNQLHSPCTDNQCLKTIQVDEVYKKVLGSLKGVKE